MKIALCVNEDYGDTSLNAAYMEEKIIEASYNDADIIIFPNYAFNEKLTNVLKDDVAHLENIDEIICDLKMFAQNYAIHLVFGYARFNGEEIINEFRVISYEGKEVSYHFDIDKRSFSLNDYEGDYVIDLLNQDYIQDKKIFKVNRLYKNENSGGAVYYYNEIIKEIEENKESIIYVEFDK